VEKATFDTKLSLDENFELILKNADAADPQLATIFRSIMPLLTTPSSDADRKTARAMFHKMAKSDLDKVLAEDAK
jgi:hypothetical protein